MGFPGGCAQPSARHHIRTIRVKTASACYPLRTPHQSEFTPLRPPDPSTLPKPKLRSKRREKVNRAAFKTAKWTLYLALAAGTVYLFDNQFNAAAITRSSRTFYTGLVIAVDYKMNFRAKPWTGGTIRDLHNRNAQRIFDLLRNNGGLYLKIGQAIAMQSAVLPPEFQKMFSRMFDDAPQNDWKDVEKVVREDFGGKTVEEVFGVSFAPGGEPGKGVMEKRARASASVAQVHWARLADGREVAIKVQKREIAQQVGWDLWAFKIVARVYSYWFDLPMYSLVPFISERLLLETDFVNEANNSVEMASLVAGEPRLRGRVYIPKVYREYSSKRIMTAEWIEGVRLWDKDGITGNWYGGWREGSPGAGGKLLPFSKSHSSPTRNRSPPPDHSASFDARFEELKPDRSSWKGRSGRGGLGLDLGKVMTTMVDLFSAQMFLWGLVHCDPHPGNIFIRRLPSGKPELVLIDHGLYIRMSPEFRTQYASFWKALISFDNAKIREVVNSWGVSNPDIFASATLLRPYEGGDGSTMGELGKDLKGKDESERAYEMQQKMRKGIRQILGDETKWPRELIFIGRNLRIVQGNNQYLGSPVNRIKITGLWASRALIEDKNLPVLERVKNLGRHLLFRTVLLGSDVVWWWARIRQLLGWGRGMDQDLEDQMKKMAKGFGVELQHGVFEG
ncbi:ABC1-domain-containing protein [Aulographum hederae CBS 113979]|uniref:ABC1-domain-containing protein n=1 Tax=Aulographum hederae CBS 113979 TaxID=1176131 RepID=A0A6G1GPY5_9PEZI|nr:ABC1-domain-containing protein [Aulographum hederae CBS 113979]